MAGFSFRELELPGAYLIDYFAVRDHRGGFAKVFEKDEFLNGGIRFQLNETFFSMSAKNVIRGLHFQKNNPQNKIVTIAQGAVWDVIVDLRPDSPTYKKWTSAELSEENHLGFYIPRGFAHGFLTLRDDTIMVYQCEGKYDAETDAGILYNDEDIAIRWPVDLADTIHSARDLQLETFRQYEKNPMKL